MLANYAGIAEFAEGAELDGERAVNSGDQGQMSQSIADSFPYCPTCTEPIGVHETLDPHTAELACARGHRYWATSELPFPHLEEIRGIEVTHEARSDPNACISYWLGTPVPRASLNPQLVHMLLRCGEVFRGISDGPESTLDNCPRCRTRFTEAPARGDVWSMGLKCSCSESWWRRSGISQAGSIRLMEAMTLEELKDLLRTYVADAAVGGPLTRSRWMELHPSIVQTFQRALDVPETPA